MGTQYSQLSMDERCEIFRLHAGRVALRGIGRQLGRSGATVSREIRRNSGVQVGYKVSWAMIQARARRCRKLYKMQRSSALRETILERLAMAGDDRASVVTNVGADTQSDDDLQPKSGGEGVRLSPVQDGLKASPPMS